MFTTDEFTACMDFLSGGDYSRRTLAAEAWAEAEAKAAKAAVARAEAAEDALAKAEAKLARLTPSPKKARGPKNGGGR
jgi:hypothetical protein